MAYSVNKIIDSRRMNDFIELPYKIYKNDPRWVAPLKSEVCRTLDTKANPYFVNASLQKFICYKDNDPVARIAIIINYEHWKKFNCKTAFFGFFESINDFEASKRLFETVGQYCQSEGVEHLEGPFNPNHYSELGILIKNFDTPKFFETYNPEYYPALLEKSGFKVSKLLHTRFNADTASFVRQRYNLASPLKNTGHFKVRHINLLNMKTELERVREVFNEAFSDNWYFLPLSKKEYSFAAKSLFFVTYPKLIAIVEHNNKPVGVLQCVLNINKILEPLKGKLKLLDYLKFLKNRSSICEIIIYAIGIKKEYQSSIVIKLLISYLCNIVQEYPAVSTTWMSDDNVTAIRASKLFGLEPYKWFAIYEKTL